MTPQEETFVNYWAAKRKTWKWSTHLQKTFFKIVLPIVVLIDLVNYFIIGDTEYSFFSFTHLFRIIVNIIFLGVVIIMSTGIVEWNYNESKYWGILRKYMNKLQ